jgi:exodeoxyribonuclease V alpha subunit
MSHRQKGCIAINARRINDGLGVHTLNLDDESFKFVPASKEEAREKTIEAYMRLLHSGYDVSDICCIVPIRKSGRTQTAAEDLNALLREKINPEKAGSPTLKGCPLRVGDRVMNLENDYQREIFNGDCGIVFAIYPDTNLLVLRMDDGRYVDCSIKETRQLTLAYALTAHKSQGSEYKGVVVVQNKEHYFMLQRNLLYTAVTRAKEKVILVGEKAAINMAVGKIPSLERNTTLRSRLKTEMVKKLKQNRS